MHLRTPSWGTDTALKAAVLSAGLQWGAKLVKVRPVPLRRWLHWCVLYLSCFDVCPLHGFNCWLLFRFSCETRKRKGEMVKHTAGNSNIKTPQLRRKSEAFLPFFQCGTKLIFSSVGTPVLSKMIGSSVVRFVQGLTSSMMWEQDGEIPRFAHR